VGLEPTNEGFAGPGGRTATSRTSKTSCGTGYGTRLSSPRCKGPGSRLNTRGGNPTGGRRTAEGMVLLGTQAGSGLVIAVPLLSTLLSATGRKPGNGFRYRTVGSSSVMGNQPLLSSNQAQAFKARDGLDVHGCEEGHAVETCAALFAKTFPANH